MYHELHAPEKRPLHQRIVSAIVVLLSIATLTWLTMHFFFAPPTNTQTPFFMEYESPVGVDYEESAMGNSPVVPPAPQITEEQDFVVCTPLSATPKAAPGTAPGATPGTAPGPAGGTGTCKPITVDLKASPAQTCDMSYAVYDTVSTYKARHPEEDKKLEGKYMCPQELPICKKDKKTKVKTCVKMHEKWSNWMITIDAGSSGTRIFPLFYTAGRPLPDSFEQFHEKDFWPIAKECVIAKFGEEEICTSPDGSKWINHIKLVWDWAYKTGLALTGKKPTHVLAGATAGARVQMDTDWDDLKKRFQAIRGWATNDAPEAYVDVRIISGNEEAYYTWVAAQHALHGANFATLTPQDTVNTIEIGGASMQIAMAMKDADQMAKDGKSLVGIIEDKYEIVMNGAHLSIFAKSTLWGGKNLLYTQFVEGMKEKTYKLPKNPPTDMSLTDGPYTRAEICALPCNWSTDQKKKVPDGCVWSPTTCAPQWIESSKTWEPLVDCERAKKDGLADTCIKEVKVFFDMQQTSGCWNLANRFDADSLKFRKMSGLRNDPTSWTSDTIALGGKSTYAGPCILGFRLPREDETASKKWANTFGTMFIHHCELMAAIKKNPSWDDDEITAHSELLYETNNLENIDDWNEECIKPWLTGNFDMLKSDSDYKQKEESMRYVPPSSFATVAEGAYMAFYVNFFKKLVGSKENDPAGLKLEGGEYPDSNFIVGGAISPLMDWTRGMALVGIYTADTMKSGYVGGVETAVGEAPSLNFHLPHVGTKLIFDE